MSTVRIIYVWGDAEPQDDECLTHTGDGSILGGADFLNNAEARKAARAEGWHSRPERRDICPPCWEAGAR